MSNSITIEEGLKGGTLFQINTLKEDGVDVYIKLDLVRMFSDKPFETIDEKVQKRFEKKDCKFEVVDLNSKYQIEQAYKYIYKYIERAVPEDKLSKVIYGLSKKCKTIVRYKEEEETSWKYRFALNSEENYNKLIYDIKNLRDDKQDIQGSLFFKNERNLYQYVMGMYHGAIGINDILWNKDQLDIDMLVTSGLYTTDTVLEHNELSKVSALRISYWNRDLNMH